MAADEDRDRREPVTHGVAPGALSALLEQLAHVPEVSLGEAGGLAPRPGTVIGRFELAREIGRGGFGVVYEARDRELGRSVAFKLVRPGRLEVGEDRLRREAEVIAHLSHPNLVTLFDVGRCEHGPYLVLELLRGETLDASIARGPMPVRDAVRVATEIAKGLRHAHAQGVVHRDLKPSNVFLCEGGQVKLLDFGMAHAFGRRRVDGGTPGYMAPEQHLGAPEDERTDVWALGVMLFRMLAKEHPFAGEKPDPGRAPPALDVAGAPELGELVARMLAPDPTRRPRDASEVLAPLSALLERLARPGAPPPGPVRKAAASRLGRLPRLAVAIAIAAAALAVFVLPRRTPPPRSRAIAVVPFANMGSRGDDDYFSDGLTEEIVNLLTRLRELKVAGSATSFYLRDRKTDVRDVARRLQIDVVLEGSVRRDKDRLRIAAELVDARSGFLMWSQMYDRRLEDVFAIQDDIARQVVGALELVLSRASEGELGKPRAASLAAYDLYLRGRAALRLPPSAATVDRASSLFEQSIAADGQFAQAYAGLCDAWLSRYRLDRATESFAKAESACTTALQRDRHAGEVYVALGNLHLSSGQYVQAEGEFRTAAGLATTQVDALLGLARTREAQRRLDEAERTFADAKKIEPGYWLPYQELGNLLLHSGRYADAAREYQEVIQRTPEHAEAHNALGAARYMSGDFDEAARAWRASLELAPTASAYSNLGSSYFFLGQFERAAAMYLKAAELVPRDHRVWGNLADAWTAAAGHEADAASAYRKAATLAEERLRINEADADTMAQLASFYARIGRADRARQLADEASKRDPRNANVQYYAAIVAVRLGATETALAALERGVELGYPRQLLSRDAGLAPLFGQPRFAALLAPSKR
ncbi:MAG TPA: protein kinase [Anaeromyxobacter sp.]